jgi:hypothetical protein
MTAFLDGAARPGRIACTPRQDGVSLSKCRSSSNDPIAGLPRPLPERNADVEAEGIDVVVVS